MGFTYLRPAFEGISGLTPELLALLLLVFGVASFAGNALAGPLADRRLPVLVIAAPVAIGTGTVVFALLGSSLALAFVTVFVWGLGFGAVPTMVQTWIARVAPERLGARAAWSWRRSRSPSRSAPRSAACWPTRSASRRRSSAAASRRGSAPGAQLSSGEVAQATVGGPCAAAGSVRHRRGAGTPG